MSANTTPLSTLLHAFRRHADLRRRHASVGELASSRRHLYEAGMAAYRATEMPPR